LCGNAADPAERHDSIVLQWSVHFGNRRKGVDGVGRPVLPDCLDNRAAEEIKASPHFGRKRAMDEIVRWQRGNSPDENGTDKL
jgi:hypothetical protein